MSIEKFIKENVKSLGDKVFVAPEIPEKKINGGIAGMAQGVNPEYVLAVVDTTIFGSSTEGCLFTGEHVYMHALGSDAVKIQLSTISKAEYVCTEIKKDNGKVEQKKDVIIHFKDGGNKNITKDISMISLENFAELINGIVEQAQDESDFVSTSQTCPLSMMEVGIKKSYIKLVCNFTFSDDNQIDAEEYAEIISLIVRIEMAAEDRLEIRGYMTDYEKIENSEDLLAYLDENIEEGSLDVVKKSLLKDIIYISRKKSKEQSWKENEFIVKLHKDLDIDEGQVEYIVAAIINDEEILSQRKNDTEITKSMKDLASKATAVGVPLAAIYLSGSVMGVSAAGITSGLASIGMGGVLGFSSMFTGIGVAVLLGVGTYFRLL